MLTSDYSTGWWHPPVMASMRHGSGSTSPATPTPTAILRRTRPRRWQPSEVRGTQMATAGERARIRQHNQKIDQRVADLNAEIAELPARFRKKRFTEFPGVDAKDGALGGKLTAALVAAADKRN